MKYFFSFFAFLIQASLVAQDTLAVIELEDDKFQKGIGIKEEKITITDKSISVLSESLQNAPGFYIKNYGPTGISTLNYRGTSASQNQVIWNDIPLNSITLGQTDLSIIQLSGDEALSLVVGGNKDHSSVGVLGASLQIRDTLTTSHLNWTTTLGSLGNIGNALRFGKKEKNAFWSFKWYSSQRNNRFKYFNPYQQKYIERSKANQNQRGIQGRFNYQISKRTKISAGVWYDHSDKDIPTDISSSLQYLRNSLTENTRAYLNLRSSKDYSNSFIQASFSKQDYLYSDSINKISSKIGTKQWNLKGKYSRVINNWSFLATLSSELAFAESSGFKELKKYWLNEVHTRVRLATKLGSFEYSPALVYRTDISSKILHKIGWQKAWGSSRVFIRLSNNVRFPTMNDLYWFTGSDVALKAEKALQKELGYSIKRKKIALNFGVYTNNIENYIQWVPNNLGVWSPQNISKVESKGIDGSLFYQINQRLGAKFSIAYNKTINRINNKEIIYNPNWQINNSISYKVNHHLIHLNYTFKDKVFITRDNYGYLPFISLFDMIYSREFKLSNSNIRTQIGVYNIMGVDYQMVANQPMPKRNIKLTFSLFW
jgi:iron complex outermembrane receptor protein